MKPIKNHRAKSAPTYRFRLYVAGDAQNSAQAITNLTAFCQTYLKERHTIEVVNVFKEPKRALADRIFLTPTLLKLAPPPAPTKIVGTLSQNEAVLQALGLSADAL